MNGNAIFNNQATVQLQSGTMTFSADATINTGATINWTGGAIDSTGVFLNVAGGTVNRNGVLGELSNGEPERDGGGAVHRHQLLRPR